MQKVLDVKVALQQASQTPARYQKLFLPAGIEMQDDQDLSNSLETNGGYISVAYQMAKPQDFVQAVCNGVNDIFALRYMIQRADINAKVDSIGRQPCLNDGIQNAQENHLLSVGMKGGSALHHAANHGHTEVVRLILAEP